MTYAKRRAFTMLELLIVIGVIIILAGMLVYGLKAFSNSSKERETKVTLEIANGMLAEIDAKVKLGSSNMPQLWWIQQSPPMINPATDSVVSANPDIDFWHMPYKTTTTPAYPLPITAPGSVKPEDLDQSNNLANVPYALKNTVFAMARLLGATANRAKVEGLPPQRVLRFRTDDTVNTPSQPGPPKTGFHEEDYPLLLDGWGNPILFVPASGLTNVSLSDGNLHTITSTKVRLANEYAVMGTDRPFFASAGPDGDFSKGDDNVYSFEQQ